MATRKLSRPLIWLESFAAAVDAGSIEGAARTLGVARSVVSEHIRALEDALTDGEPLLERGPGRRLQLTSRGARLHEGTRTQLEQLDVRRLQDLASTGARLRLGLNPTLSTALFGELARGAAEAAFRLEASFGGAVELVRRVQVRQLDLALTFTPLPPHVGVERERLVRLPFVVLAAEESPLCRTATASPRLTVEELEGERFVDWSREDPYGGANSARFAARSVDVHEVARAESFLQLYELLRAFSACAVAPDLGRIHPFPEDLRAWPLQEVPPQTVDVVALWPHGGPIAEARTVLERLRTRWASSEASPSP